MNTIDKTYSGVVLICKTELRKQQKMNEEKDLSYSNKPLDLSNTSGSFLEGTFDAQLSFP